MGPRRIRRGEPDDGTVKCRGGSASMGPRRIRRGEQGQCGGLLGLRRDRFNGATANSPWRTHRRAVGQADPREASMGPRRIRRGELASSGRRVFDRRGFNGATANSPWRTTRRATTSSGRKPSFNGATANSPWRTMQVLLGVSNQSRLLQWGHGEFAVENRGAPALFASGTRGFNGATANSPWRTPRHLGQSPGASRSLQWGHGEFAVENTGRCPFFFLV